MSDWQINLEHTTVSIKDLTQGDWAQLREIRDDIMRMEKIVCPEKGILCAFIAFLHIRSIVDETKRSIDDELH
jgi:hypothetical protein